MFEVIIYVRSDNIRKKKNSANILGRRFSQDTATTRVVFVTHSDAPLSYRFSLFGNTATSITAMASIIGNTFLFCNFVVFAVEPVQHEYVEVFHAAGGQL